MNFKILIASVFVGLLVMALGCEQEGPAERAGENVDEAVEQSKESMSDAMDAAGEQIEEAGDAVRAETE